MAEIVVTRSNGEQVVLVLNGVDRWKREVVIDIPEFNSRFTFLGITGKVALANGGRQLIDDQKPATTHVSRSVYLAMAKWAGSILNDRRR